MVIELTRGSPQDFYNLLHLHKVLVGCCQHRFAVLDASAVMTFFDDRPGAEKVERLFTEAVQGKRELFMSVVNWGEVYYSVWRTKGNQIAERVLSEIARCQVRKI